MKLVVHYCGLLGHKSMACRNRPLKFSWKINCLHFLYTTQVTIAMNGKWALFWQVWFPALLLRKFFVGTSKITQNGN